MRKRLRRWRERLRRAKGALALVSRAPTQDRDRFVS